MKISKPLKPQKSSNPWKAIGLASAVGIDLAICTVAGFYLGSWLDKIWGGSGLWVAAGVLLGLFTGGFTVVMVIRKVMGESDEGSA